MNKDLCQRCGETGEDRRTLWMACLYAMDELGIPFDQFPLFHADVDSLERVTEPETIDTEWRTITVKQGTYRSDQPLQPQVFFRLRVCKDCRSAWLESIRAWWNNLSRAEIEESPGSGIFIRHLGTNLEISEETYAQMYPGRTPHRIVPPEEQQE